MAGVIGGPVSPRYYSRVLIRAVRDNGLEIGLRSAPIVAGALQWTINGDCACCNVDVDWLFVCKYVLESTFRW